MKIIKSSEGNWLQGKGGLNYKKKVRMTNIPHSVNVIQDIVIPAGGSIPLHRHKQTSEVFYIISGTPVIIIEKKEFVLAAGDMVFVEVGEEHGFKNNSSVNASFLVLKINFEKNDAVLY